MKRQANLIRSIVVAVIFAMLLAPAAQAGEEEFYFEPNSSSCGDFAPINPDLKQRTSGDRYQVRVEFEITEEQIEAYECAGSHFDVQIGFSGFDPWNDWSSCTIDFVEHDYTFGTDIVDNGDGTAVATLRGAKLTDDRLSPGDVYWITVDCLELWPGGETVPSVSVDYIGAWYSIDPDGGAPTGFETDETENNPGGLPVYVEYTGHTAQLISWEWEVEFPFEY